MQIGYFCGQDVRTVIKMKIHCMRHYANGNISFTGIWRYQSGVHLCSEFVVINLSCKWNVDNQLLTTQRPDTQ